MVNKLRLWFNSILLLLRIETQQLGHFAFITGRCTQIYRTLTSKQPNLQSLLLFVVVRKRFFASFPCAV